MVPTIDIGRMIQICFIGQFFVYGFMAFALYPYDDYDTAERMKHTGSKRYLRARRMLGVVYILLFITTIFGICPAVHVADEGWQVSLVPAWLTLFFVAHTWMLLGLCDWAPRKVHALCLLPLPVLCAVYAVFPVWGELVAVLQSIHLIVLTGYYTPLFNDKFSHLNKCCWNALNETFDNISADYDCLPESMPWIGRRYKILLIITLLALWAHFLPYDWGAYVTAMFFIGYLFWFFYWVFQRFPLFARVLFYYMNEEVR